MTAFDELHPVVRKHIEMTGNAQGSSDKICGCYFQTSPIFEKNAFLCRFHTGMSLGVDEALEWAEKEEEK